MKEEKHKHHLDEKIKSLLILCVFIFVLLAAIIFVYKFYFKINLSDIESFKESRTNIQDLTVISQFKTANLENKNFYDLKKGNFLEYKEQVKAISSGSEAPLSPVDIEVIDPEIGQALVIFWQKPEEVEYDFVRIYRSDGSSREKEIIADNLANSGSHKDDSLEDGQTYYYEVRSVLSIKDEKKESTANKDYTAVPTDKTPPSSPTNLEVINTKEGNQLKLTWENPPEEDFDHIRIYRSESLGALDSDSEVVKVLNQGDQFIDKEVKDNFVYYYTITAVDKSGNESNKDLILSAQGNSDPFNTKGLIFSSPKENTAQ